MEHHHQIGGYCSSFKRREFVFNTGVADISGLWNRGPTKILLDRLGLDKDELFVKIQCEIHLQKYVDRC